MSRKLQAAAQDYSTRPQGRPRGEQVENATRRRKQIIEAAIESIVERGLSATTLATVAQAAGLSQGVTVFYFKTKENLLVETLRYHYVEYHAVWTTAVAQAGPDPLDRLMALVFADLDPRICTPRNLTLWNSFWGEASARPKFAEMCEDYDGDRFAALAALCRQCEGLLSGPIWTPDGIADALDSMTDGMWIRMHITPDFMTPREGRLMIGRFLATVFPSQAARILDHTDQLNT